MINKEQLLYFFLQGKISLSQYDYKFMANLQSMIQNKNRVTSNQATLFDNLISKYKKQLTKNGYDKDVLKGLPWKTLVVESTPEYTGALVSLDDNTLVIRVPFNKTFITAFRNIHNNTFDWDKDSKTYKAKFSTNALKIAYVTLPAFFNPVRYDENLSGVIGELEKYNELVWNPTLRNVNGKVIVGAVNNTLGTLLQDIEVSISTDTFFKMSRMGIDVDPTLYENNPELEFAAKPIYEIEITEVEQAIQWMEKLGCKDVIIGRGLRNIINQEGLKTTIESYGMQAINHVNYGNTIPANAMLLQHTSGPDVRLFTNKLSKIVVLKDSRPVEVK